MTARQIQESPADRVTVADGVIGGAAVVVSGALIVVAPPLGLALVGLAAVAGGVAALGARHGRDERDGAR
jgi:heme A synthase